MAERGPVQVNIPRDLFYGEADYEIRQPLQLARSAGNHHDLAEAAKLLADANFPVIVSGGGVIMSNGVEALVDLAELLGAPVVNTYLHNDSFPANHPLAAGPLGYQGSKAAMRLIAKADVVLALGTRLGPFGTLPQYDIDYWPENAAIIQVDADHRMLGLVHDVAVAIQGDAAAAAVDLTGRLRQLDLAAASTMAERAAEIAAQREAWAEELGEWSSADVQPMAPRRALAELQSAMPEDAMVTTDIGNICSVANSYLSFEQPRSLFAAMMWGNCGYAFPTAMGAKVAAPDRPAIAYVGDGAWGMSLAETMTCVREGIPVVAVVFNNGQWGAEKKNQIDFYDDRFVGTNLSNPSFAAIGEAMGARGVRVDDPSVLGDALRESAAADRATVLEVVVNQELGDPFRRDALRKPVRLLEKYAGYE
jgi:sulfoacetaldehyde acetyltransferase